MMPVTQMTYLSTLLRSKKERSAQEALEKAEDAFNSLVDKLEGTKRAIQGKQRQLRKASQAETFDVETQITLGDDIDDLKDTQGKLRVIMEVNFPGGKSPELPVEDAAD